MYVILCHNQNTNTMKNKLKLSIYREKGDKRDKFDISIGKYKKTSSISKPLAILASGQENYRKIFITQMNMFIVLEWKKMKHYFPETYNKITLKEYASNYFDIIHKYKNFKP